MARTSLLDRGSLQSGHTNHACYDCIRAIRVLKLQPRLKVLCGAQVNHRLMGLVSPSDVGSSLLGAEYVITMDFESYSRFTQSGLIIVLSNWVI